MSIDSVSLYIGIHTLGGVVMIFRSLFFFSGIFATSFSFLYSFA